ncbi:MAG TPA: hypothetical protein VM165_23640 [Planctomycetaceae bacterium]|nr:hypothetical protein [Planctomycetaceae bacterium]
MSEQAGRMRILRSPLCWLLVQAVAGWLLLGTLGKLAPVVADDTAGYEQVPFDSLAGMLNQTRTIGYPLFLKFAGLFATQHGAVPTLHWLMHVAAALLFWRAIIPLVPGPRPAALMTSGLLWSSLVFRYLPVLAADMLACSLAVATLSCLLLVVQQPGSGARWLGLTVLLFATYQTRPAYLFLVGLVPLLGALLVWWQSRDERSSVQPLATRLTLASLGPLITFCTVRWLIVGHFGLVSFGGFNLIGIAGQFLSPELVAELPSNLQPLAQDMLARKQALIDPELARREWSPRSYIAVETHYDTAMWKVFTPAATELCGSDPACVDQQGRDLASAIIRQRPALYANWLLRAFRQAIRVVTSEFVMNLFSLALIAIGLLIETRYTWLRRRGPTVSVPLDDRYFEAVHVQGLIAVSFALSKIALVILVAPPLGRFMDAAGIFLPSVAIAWLCGRWEAMRQLTSSQSRA